MKKHFKAIFSVIIVLSLLVSLFSFNASAASVTASGGNYEVGQKVNISINYKGDAALYGVEINASYNSSVLRLDSVSGISASDLQNSNGTVKFIDDNFSNGSSSSSYTLHFTAIAAGNSNVTVSAVGSDGDSEFPASTSAAVKVVTPKPSSNANLSSIKLSSGSLSPAFNPNTTSYTATVKYSVDSITVTGSVADGGATYVGGGTFALNVGDNSRTLTVTAADGSKKSYTINIKRMTEQETADAEQAARDANPLLVIINDIDYTIVNNFEGITIPTGFTQGTATRKESEITVLNDEKGKYQLCWLTDANGENGAWYKRDENDNFTKLAYIYDNDIMYIIEKIDIDTALPEGYKLIKDTVNGVEVDAIIYEDEALCDFGIYNCYIAGQTEGAYYRYDVIEGTMQRAVAFFVELLNVENAEDTDAEPQQNTGKFAWFTNMNKTGKLVFAIIVFAAVVLIAAAIILIVKIAASRDDYDDEYTHTANSDFVLNDFSEEILPQAESQVIEDEPKD